MAEFLNPDPEQPDPIREALFHSEVLEHYESGHYHRLKRGIRHFLQIYHHFSGCEHSRIQQMRDDLVSRFEDMNEDLRRITQEIVTLEQRLINKNIPRHNKNSLKRRVKQCNRAVKYILRTYGLGVRQLGLLNSYIEDCKFYSSSV